MAQCVDDWLHLYNIDDSRANNCIFNHCALMYHVNALDFPLGFYHVSSMSFPHTHTGKCLFWVSIMGVNVTLLVINMHVNICICIWKAKHSHGRV